MQQKGPSAPRPSILSFTVIVAALGYFVDIYDLVLYGIVREKSLQALGVPAADIFTVGAYLFNWQMGGMLVGGILWGILGDKRGRISVLFGSIFLYSVANIANAFVTSIDAYAACRLIAGIGLAGELGAAITLVAETLPKETRGYGTAIVAAIGILGAVAAGLIGDMVEWTTAYIIGGLLGLLLLIARISVYESGMYHAMKEQEVSRGNFMMLFTDRRRFLRYLRCILIGIPLWYVVGILMIFAPELSREIGIEGITAGQAIMFCYMGLVVGDLASGFLSQFIGSRKRIIFSFLLITTALILVYLLMMEGAGTDTFYLICGLLGIGAGYWAVFVTTASEQFGTNLRATVTTTVPNFVRGAVIPLTLLLRWLQDAFRESPGAPGGLVESALVVGLLTLVVSFAALMGMEESYHKDLDFLETAEVS